jgi:hypothetical protein
MQMADEQEYSGKKPIQTSTRWGKLSSIFSPRVDKELHALIASLCVLFEDQRIEMLGLSAKELGRLDTSGKHLRELYFLRRSTATVFEFATILDDLDQLPSFQAIRARFDQTAERIWKQSLRYFRAHKQYITRMRHHVGGHFGKQAAKLAIENLLPDAIGSMEVAFYDGGGGAKLFFASELAATAALRNVRASTSQAKARKMLRHSLVAYRHAAWAVDCITTTYLWDKFGR